MREGGTPSDLHLGRGTPIQPSPGDTPFSLHLGGGGSYHMQPHWSDGGTPCQVGWGYQAIRLDGGTPSPHRAGWVTPSPWETEQHSEYLLHGGRYASCVHAEALSCSACTHVGFWFVRITAVQKKYSILYLIMTTTKTRLQFVSRY